MEDAKAENQIISCVITDLYDTSASVTWTDEQGANIAADDTDNYVVAQGQVSSGSQTTQLTIKKAKLITLAASATFGCSVTSGEYPASDPFETDVTVSLGYGKFFRALHMLMIHERNLVQF